MEKTSNQMMSASYRRPRVATTANRKMVSRPVRDQMINSGARVVIKRTTQAQAQSEVKLGSAAQQPQQSQTSKSVVAKSTEEKRTVRRPTAQEIKQDAIEKALSAASKQDTDYEEKKTRPHFEFKRVALALACAAAATFAIVYFVNLNAPNISLKVTAMQTGIDASYPSYVPRDFSLSDITTEDGRMILNFSNASTGSAFTLTEEKSSWDSNALLNNYVRNEYGEDYATIREQGLTIYISEGNAAWVNGGVVYKIEATSGLLTKKQIKSIAVSL